jgi:amphiphysin
MAFTQLGISEAFKDLYSHIAAEVDETEEPRIIPTITPSPQMQRTSHFQHACSGLQQEIREEITTIETLLLRPANDTQVYLQPIRKDIKRRDKARVDYENALTKTTKMQRKPGKTPKEESMLEKAQFDTQVMLEAFEETDGHLRETLLPLVQAASNIIPYLLASVVLIQNRLLGLCYTIMHEFCLDNNFPSPAPGMDAVMGDWDQSFRPVVTKVESFAIVRKHPMTVTRRAATDRPAVRRVASFHRPPGRISSAPAPDDIPPVPTPEPREPSPKIRSTATTPGNSGVPTDFTTATVLRAQRSMPSLKVRSQSSSYFNQAAIAKKKPPPPPVPKIKRPAEFVEAQFDFEGEGAGDLSFRAGDRIRIIKKTNTDQDWWQGELGGCQGSFPANYCTPIASN